jgi:hypothetical protein
MLKTLRQIIDDELAKTTDTDRLKELVIDLAELADSKGATEAEMKETFRVDLAETKDA